MITLYKYYFRSQKEPIDLGQFLQIQRPIGAQAGNIKERNRKEVMR
jgi:hypothetical protein